MSFSLKTLLLIFTVAAVSIAGLMFANVAWAAFFYTAAFALVLTGIVGALVRRRPASAYWIGFAFFGAGYFGLALVGENFLSRFAVYQQLEREPKLATTQVLIRVERYIHLASDSNNAGAPPSPGTRGRTMTFGPGGVTYAPMSPTDYFVEVGHSILTLILALVGGWIGIRFARQPVDAEPHLSKL